jgi:small subunit ribosomal protein S9
VSEEEKNDEPEVEVDVELDVDEEATPEDDTAEAVEAEAVTEEGAAEEEEAAEEVAADEAVVAEVVVEEVLVEEVVPVEASGSDLPPGADLEPIPVEPEVELSAEERARLEAEEEERAQREAAESDSEDDDLPAAPPAPAKIAKDARFIATGKRKRSVARVIVMAGDGKVTINDREFEEYFPRARHRTVVNSPLVVTGYESNVDIRIRVHGGGISGQAGAVRHGIARALIEVDSELRPELKRRGFLTRDARAKERRKAGLKKARKRPQFSKR